MASTARKLEHWTKWFGRNEEQVATVPFGDGNVVIRGRPDARVVTVFEVPWRVEVRYRSKDPFGPPLWTGHAPNRTEGIKLVDEVARQIRAGSPPWS